MGIRRIQCRSCFDGVSFKVNLVSFGKLSPKMRGCVNDDTTVAGFIIFTKAARVRFPVRKPNVTG